VRLLAIDHDANLRDAVERVILSRTTIEIELAEGRLADDQNRILIIPWTPPSPYRRLEIIQGDGEQPCAMPPMRTKARVILIEALRDAHRWLDELMTNSSQTTEALAGREGKTERSIRMTLSLAFLSPALAQSAALHAASLRKNRSRWCSFPFQLPSTATSSPPLSMMYGG
jgi:hypothetical protein